MKLNEFKLEEEGFDGLLEELKIWGVTPARHLCEVGLDLLKEGENAKAETVLQEALEKLQEMNEVIDGWFAEARGENKKTSKPAPAASAKAKKEGAS